MSTEQSKYFENEEDKDENLIENEKHKQFKSKLLRIIIIIIITLIIISIIAFLILYLNEENSKKEDDGGQEETSIIITKYMVYSPSDNIKLFNENLLKSIYSIEINE